jgi:hypothetical protein
MARRLPRRPGECPTADPHTKFLTAHFSRRSIDSGHQRYLSLTMLSYKHVGTRIIPVTHFGRRRFAITPNEKRRFERLKVNAPALVETPGSRLAVTIVDYSATGARAITTSPPPWRRDVCLHVNGLALFSTIVWRKDYSLGLKFDSNLSAFELAELQAALIEAESIGRHFDRESVLRELANKPVCTDGEDEQFECEQEAVTDPR